MYNPHHQEQPNINSGEWPLVLNVQRLLFFYEFLKIYFNDPAIPDNHPSDCTIERFWLK